MYSVINPQGDKSSCQCLRRERKLCCLFDSVIIGSSVIKMLFENLKRLVLKYNKNSDYQSDTSVRVKRLAKEPGALPEAKNNLNFGDTSIETCENSQYLQVQDVSPTRFPPALRPELFLNPSPQCLSLLLELLAR